MSFYILEKQNLEAFLKSLQKNFRVFIPRQEARLHRENKNYTWMEFTGGVEDVVIGGFRTSGPLKSFFFSSSEIVSRDFETKEPLENTRPFAIIGAKSCDLAGLKISDYVFTQEPFRDPFYIEKRNQNLIISSDCTSTCEECFCTALGNKPYPEKGFDLNFSEMEKSYIVEIGSDKGKAVIAENPHLFKELSERIVARRLSLRDEVTKLVEDNIKRHHIPVRDQLPGVMKKGFDSKIWETEALACVECGACNLICPTCHCFYLSDIKLDSGNIRYKLWDACLYKDFARVAGGANPRHKLWMRLRNRYDKKFDYFPHVMDEYACTGCGRCVSCCPAKIDIRRILKNLVKEAKI